MRYIFFFGVLLFSISCSQATQQRASKIDDKEVKSNNFSGTAEQRLAHMIRRAGNGALVTQQGQSFRVKIRGASSSFQGNTNPLFVLNGISIGHDFTQAAGAITGGEIRSVKILKGKDATIYGTRGSAGVIEIKTR